MKFTISPLATAITLAIAGLILVVAGVVAEVGGLTHGEDWAFGLIAMVSLDYEGNLPSWYLSMLLLFAAGLAGLIAQAVYLDRAKHRRHWAAVALVLLAASIAVTSDADITVLHPVTAFIAQAVNPNKIVTALAVCATVACAALSVGFFRAQARSMQISVAGAAALYLAVPVLRDSLIATWYRLGAPEGHEALLYGFLQIADTGCATFATIMVIAALMIRLFDANAELRIAVQRQTASSAM